MHIRRLDCSVTRASGPCTVARNWEARSLRAFRTFARARGPCHKKAFHRLMRILGIDPGLQLTGYGVIDLARPRPKLIDGGVIRLNVKTPIPDRLVELETELEGLLTEHKPDICAVEQLYS